MTFLCVQATWPGRLHAAALGPALDATVDNPWARLAEACPDTTDQGRLDWAPYDRARALDIIDRDRRALFLRERAGEGAVEAQVWSHPDDTSLILYVPCAPDGRLRDHLGRVVAALPAGGSGTVFAPAVEPAHPSDALPAPLARAPWLAMWPAAARPRWLSPEALRGAPASRVDVAPDGTLWLEFYRDPFAPPQAEVETVHAWLDRAARAG
ncbi:hypothetical protein [Sorangium sp. So ce542]|uniref:hypothetical protein n=1 Tax=Sorangium sp. So ce542 TaxID=3133316 RepID=UPI003F5EE28B